MSAPGTLPLGVAAEPSSGIERRGIDHVPGIERWGTPRSLFWMWAGAIFNVEYIVYGALLVAVFGLSFAQSVLVVLLSNLSYVLTGLTSLQGPDAGTTTFTISRAAFGPNGNRVPALFNWLTQVGFETEGVALIVLAGLAMAAKAGLNQGTGLKVALILGAACAQLVLPLLGHGAILRVLRVLTIPFAAVFVVMTVLAAGHARLHAASHGASWGTVMVASALLISAGGLGWTENANDYSRYLPAHSSKAAIVFWVTLGCALPSVVTELLGAAVATGVPSSSNPIQGLPHSFPGWFVVPYLAIVVVQLLAINTLDLYSSGVTLQSLGLPLRRMHCVLVDTIVCTGLTAWAIFSQSFNRFLYDFLEFIIVWLAPWCAIYLVDWLLRKGRYDPQGLQRLDGGTYWRSGGWHVPALVAQAIGMAGALMWLNVAPLYVGPLSSRVGNSDFSIYMGFFIAGLAYWILAGRLGGKGRHHGT